MFGQRFLVKLTCFFFFFPQHLIGAETEAMHGVIIFVMCVIGVAAGLEVLRRYADHLPRSWQARLPRQFRTGTATIHGWWIELSLEASLSLELIAKSAHFKVWEYFLSFLSFLVFFFSCLFFVVMRWIFSPPLLLLYSLFHFFFFFVLFKNLFLLLLTSSFIFFLFFFILQKFKFNLLFLLSFLLFFF